MLLVNVKEKRDNNKRKTGVGNWKHAVVKFKYYKYVCIILFERTQ